MDFPHDVRVALEWIETRKRVQGSKFAPRTLFDPLELLNERLELHSEFHKERCGCENIDTCNNPWAVEYRATKEKNVDPEVKVGVNVTTEEYKRIFNDEKAAVKDLTHEQIVERIAELDSLIREIKIKRAATYSYLEDVIERSTEEEKKKIRELDKQYRVSTVSNTEKVVETKKKAARAQGKSKDEKAIEAMMAAYGCSREKATNLLNSIK